MLRLFLAGGEFRPTVEDATFDSVTRSRALVVLVFAVGVDVGDVATEMVAVDSPAALVNDHVAVEREAHAHGQVVIDAMCREIAVQLVATFRKMEELRNERLGRVVTVQIVISMTVVQLDVLQL